MKKRSALGKLLRYCKRHLFALACVLILSIAGVFLTVYATTYLQQLTDYINEAAMKAQDGHPMSEVVDMAVIAQLGFTLLGMYLGAAVCTYVQAFLMTEIDQKIALRLRSDIAAKISRLPMRYFDSHATGDTLSRVTNDVDTVAQSMNASIATALTAVAQIVIVVVMMFATNWQMTLTAFATVPLSILVLLLVVRISQKHFRAQQQELGALNGQAEE